METGFALTYASDQFKNNKEVVLRAIKTNKEAYDQAGLDLINKLKNMDHEERISYLSKK